MRRLGIHPSYLPILVVVAIGTALIVFNRPGSKHAPQSVPESAQPSTFPSFPAGKEIEKGISFHELILRRGDVGMAVWVYLPKSAPATRPTKLPCILIAPAGTRLFHGINLSDGDRAEHLPYLRHGFAVLAYQIDGSMPNRPNDAQAASAIAQFRAANAGVDNARAAIDYALAKIPQIDPARIYAVGHSSAATLALQIAENDPRIAACVAFAPACNLPVRLKRAGGALNKLEYGTMHFLEQISPDSNTEKLACPTMLFTAADDTNVESTEVIDFATKLRKTNARVNLVQVKTGGHYDSMIQQGIPAAIAWLQHLPPTAHPK